ncbi:MAG: hypothetical protein HQL56_17460 [Magnetococcales bacterium]|nr:hypothetical protein [Magnetococcales bacterium]
MENIATVPGVKPKSQVVEQSFRNGNAAAGRANGGYPVVRDIVSLSVQQQAVGRAIRDLADQTLNHLFHMAETSPKNKGEGQVDRLV